MKRIIAGKYRIQRRIGKGGMSNVYLATDLKLQKNWAIKEVIGESAIREAEIMKRFDHPSLPRIVDIIEDKGINYVVMDYIEGIPLSKLLLKREKFPEETVVEWAKELASALGHLHGMDPPIIYRDMKPSNIILQKSGHLKLIDFGIAREYDNERSGDTQFLGTKGYAAPEQFGGMGQTDERTDIYCLGATLYQLITGKDPIGPIDKNSSLGLMYIILKCMEIDPSKRYPSCKRLLYDLNNIEKITKPKNRKQSGRKKLRKVFSLIVIIILCTLIGAIIQNNNNSSKKSENNFLSEDEYLSLIGEIEADGVFSSEEEVNILSLIEKDEDFLISKDVMTSLALELGKLYWYAYEYGDEMTRVRLSLPWFERTIEYGGEDSKEVLTAKLYEKMADFHNEVTMKLESEDEPMDFYYHMTTLEELLKDAEGGDSKIRLEISKLILDSVESYAGRFERDGVEESSIEALIDCAISLIEKSEELDEKDRKLKKELILRENDVRELIDRIYIK